METLQEENLPLRVRVHILQLQLVIIGRLVIEKPVVTDTVTTRKKSNIVSEVLSLSKKAGPTFITIPLKGFDASWVIDITVTKPNILII